MLPTQKLRNLPAALATALCWTLIGLAIGLLLRYQLIQPPAIGALCSAADAPAWCQLRLGIIVFGLSYGGWGIVGAVLLGLSLWLDGNTGKRLLAGALLCGGIALPLYATASGAIVLLGGWLRSLHTPAATEANPNLSRG